MSLLTDKESVAPAELKEALAAGEEPELVDVRNFSEYRLLRMARSRLIPLPELELRSGEIDCSRPLVVFCKGGTRGKQAQQLLARRGVRAANLEGGIEGWVKAGGEVISGEARKGFSVDQQTRMAIGALVLLGLVFNKGLFWLPWFVGIMMIIAGLTDTCMLMRVLAAMPWNRK